MVITWITENYYPNKGGMAQSCDRIVNGLRNSGWKIHLLHFSNRHSKVTIQKQHNGHYISVPTGDNYPHALQMGFSLVQRELKDTEKLVAFGGFLPILCVKTYANWMEIPYSVCIRGNDFDMAIFHYQRKAILLDTLKHASSVITNTSDKSLRINQLLKENKAFFIANGIEEHWQANSQEMYFAKAYRDDFKDKKIIGLFGQLKEKKGTLFFLEGVLQSGHVEHFHFIIAGEVEDMIIEFLNIHHFSYEKLEFMERYQILKYYLCCDWIALPSFYDGMPNVLLEAMSLGIPVIGSNVDGMKDVIQNNVNGMLFNCLDMADLILSLERILDYSEKELQIIKEEASKVVKEKYNLGIEIKNFKNVLSIT